VSVTYNVAISINQNEDKRIAILTTSELFVLLAGFLFLFVITAEDTIVLEQFAVREGQFVQSILACLCCKIEVTELPLESVEIRFGQHGWQKTPVRVMEARWMLTDG
jgi:hypothetical protein